MFSSKDYFLKYYSCKNIDGTSRIYLNLELICYESYHTYWALYVALPCIIVFGLGIPFFAFVLMTKQKHNLHKFEMKE